jgi:uncharacterized glyoxalase superfamily protein PhnB
MPGPIATCLVYEDAPAAIDFLCAAFGFTRHLIIPGAAPNQIAHAQLTLGDSMIMLATAGPAQRERFNLVTPSGAGGVITACLSVHVPDPDAHHDQAEAAGATILSPPHDNPFGGRAYEARDPEGTVWGFSSFDPWQAAPP